MYPTKACQVISLNTYNWICKTFTKYLNLVFYHQENHKDGAGFTNYKCHNNK